MKMKLDSSQFREFSPVFKRFIAKILYKSFSKSSTSQVSHFKTRFYCKINEFSAEFFSNTFFYIL